MYESYREGIAEERRESFPLSWIAAENLLHLSTWIAAGWLLLPIRLSGWPIATMLWAAIVVLVQVLLKKHNCSGCYYYGKSCHLGWGRLSAWACAQDSGNLRTGMRLSLFYVLSPPVILITAIVIGLVWRVGITHWIILGAYVALNAISFPVRKKGCRVCAMRKLCPGSAAKN